MQVLKVVFGLPFESFATLSRDKYFAIQFKVSDIDELSFWARRSDAVYVYTKQLHLYNIITENLPAACRVESKDDDPVIGDGELFFLIVPKKRVTVRSMPVALDDVLIFKCVVATGCWL